MSNLNKMSVKLLKNLCKEMKLKKYSKLLKADLITLIQNNQILPTPVTITRQPEAVIEPTPLGLPPMIMG